MVDNSISSTTSGSWDTDYLEKKQETVKIEEYISLIYLEKKVYKMSTGQLCQSDNICNMAFLPKGINNRMNFGGVLAQETLVLVISAAY